MSKSRTIVLSGLGLLGVFGVLACAIVLGLLLCGNLSDRSFETVSDNGEFAAITASDFEACFVFPGDPGLCADYYTNEYSDGELYFRYRYDVEKDPEADGVFQFLAYTHICPFRPLAEDAFETYKKDAFVLAALTEATTVRERKGLISVGDEHFVGMLVNEFGDEDGMAVVLRKQDTVVAFRMIGHVITDGSSLDAILAAKLATCMKER